jgi:hypothetical protein
MWKKLVLVLLSAAAVWSAGCSNCGTCGHPWFSRARRCDAPCPPNGSLPPVVGTAPAGPNVPPPPGPIYNGPGPTPDAVITTPPPQSSRSFFAPPAAPGRCCN